MGRTFLRIPFLYFMEEDYSFQVTDLQFLKACGLTSTLSSELSITRSRFSQPENAITPIVLTLDESSKLVKLVQSTNALSPILSTLDGIFTLTKSEQLANKL